MNRFLAPHDLKITYRPKRSEDSVKRLEYLMENFEALLDPMGFGCMLHKDEYEPILDCAVYACSDAMDYTIGELYVRPAETLPETESMLFKRFMSFFSSQTNIGLGLNGDSFFLEAQADYFFDEYGDMPTSTSSTRTRRRTLSSESRSSRTTGQAGTSSCSTR